jgi:EamA domain-containing membrane protein RarD
MLLASGTALLASTAEAHAYLDFGVGSMLTQLVVAMAAAAVLSVRRLFNVMKNVLLIFVTRRAKEKTDIAMGQTNCGEHVSPHIVRDDFHSADE